MHGDAFCAETLAVKRSFQDIGHVFASGIAYQGDFIDVYAQSGHCKTLLTAKVLIYFVKILTFEVQYEVGILHKRGQTGVDPRNS